VPARVIATMVARVEQAEADRKRVIRSRVAKAQRQADNDLARLPEARREFERLLAATDRADGSLVWSRPGYVPTERARLIRQEDRRRAARRTRLLRQPLGTSPLNGSH
jgi:hypothetical protein